MAVYSMDSPQNWQEYDWMSETWPGTEQDWSSDWTWNEDSWNQDWQEDESWDTSTWDEQWNNSDWQENAEYDPSSNQESSGYFLVAAAKELQPGGAWEAEDESYWLSRDEEGYLYAEGWNENNEWEEGYMDEDCNWLPEEEQEAEKQDTPLNQDGSQTHP